MKQTRSIHTRTDNGVLLVTIERPQVHNALDTSAHRELHEVFDRFSSEDALRCAILTGSGTASFCAGSDLKERVNAKRDTHPSSGFGGLTRRFDLHKPVIAAINGAAIGGGFELVLACDLAVAAPHARFCLPEPQVGLTATGGGGLQRLVRQLPWKLAVDIALAGRELTSDEALAYGLINAVAPDGQLLAMAHDYAQRIARGAPLAVEASKAVMQRTLSEADLRTAITHVHPEVERLLDCDQAREGMRAFLEKRRPDWQR
ncbi:MAG: enoyl-CoA hydratase-related protein [Gammaproteobacteria bacterium]|nr:enoyl-CoA hydratase-related protein [Gammaproteobacteria bacterium]